MNRQLLLVRIIFLAISVAMLTSYMIGISTQGATFATTIIGIVIGCVTGASLIAVESLLKEISLRTLNTACVGLFSGCLMGQGCLFLFDSAQGSLVGNFSPELSTLIRTFVLLFFSYFGISLALRAGEDIRLVIPFVKLESSVKKKKDILLDSSTLLDTRIIDLAASGLLDNHLITPRFIVKELHLLNETGEEIAKTRARRCLEALRKLEGIEGLNMRYVETDFVDLKDSAAKLARLARLTDAIIITADLNRQPVFPGEGTRAINLNSLSNALKTPTQGGEFLNVKVQRLGKDPLQGVGYLEDGTMVVINGGSVYLQRIVRAQVVCRRTTLTGSMIFCNAIGEGTYESEEEAPLQSNGNTTTHAAPAA